jgi:NADP-dependent 3-hydroxy acid dehydrogenase YdfG
VVRKNDHQNIDLKAESSKGRHRNKTLTAHKYLSHLVLLFKVSEAPLHSAASSTKESNCHSNIQIPSTLQPKTMPPFPSPTRTWHTRSYPSISPTKLSLSLAGKTILLTGGGSGIGLSIAKSLALASAKNLIILGRRESVLSSAAETITSTAGNKTRVHPVVCDVSKKEDVDAAFEKIGKLLSGVKIDVLVLNAGYFTGLRPLGTETVSEWQTAFEVNVLSLYLVTTAFLSHHPENKKGMIINISTAIAHLSASYFHGFSSYAATKLGGTKFMSYVEEENKDLKIVNVHPGQVTETDMAGKAKGDDQNELNGHIDDGEFCSCS